MSLLLLFNQPAVVTFLVMKLAFTGKRADVDFTGKRADIAFTGKRAKITMAKVDC